MLLRILEKTVNLVFYLTVFISVVDKLQTNRSGAEQFCGRELVTNLLCFGIGLVGRWLNRSFTGRDLAW